jgi:flavodoxin
MNLVAYFSHSGNTREIADQIHKIAGGDIFEIEAVKTYPEDYDACVERAKQELNTGYRPELKVKVKDIKQYDMVFIGYPDWWGTVPAPVRVFLTEYDLSGKTIVPFCTHEGSGLGRSVADISKLCPKSALLEAVAIRGGNVKNAQNQVSAWLRKIKTGGINNEKA